MNNDDKEMGDYFLQAQIENVNAGYTISPADAGCWLDECLGWYNNFRCVELAINTGMDPTEAEYAVIDQTFKAYMNEDRPLNPEYGMSEIVDKATDHLSTIAPKGYHFEWSDGGLFMWEDEKEDEDNDNG
jgi:hypothetical protein